MATEFIRRQIDRLLGQAAEALDHSDWAAVRQRAEDVLRLEPDNVDARSLEEAARRGPASPVLAESSTGEPYPRSFVNGRYEVKRFLGEGGKTPGWTGTWPLR